MEASKAQKKNTFLIPMVDLRQSDPYAKWMESMGWLLVNSEQSVVSRGNYFFLRRIPLVGSVMKVLRPTEPVPFEEIEGVAKKYRALFVKIEPGESGDENRLLADLKSHGYRRERWALIASKTLRVDLTKPEQKIFDGFKKDCRYEIRKAEERNLVIKKNDFESFYKLLSAANKIKGLWTIPKKQFDHLIHAFGKDVYCIEIRRGTPLAGCLVLVAEGTAYYFLAGSLPAGKDLQAPYLSVWEAIKEAKKRGCALWDFEGLQDDRIPSTKSWAGFSHFKRSFGGYEVTFPGTFTKYLNPILKILSPFAG